jgi:hypothetical protein
MPTLSLDALRHAAYRSVRSQTYNAFEQPVFADELPGDLVSPSHTLLVSGPPLARLAVAYREQLTPIGMLQAVEQSSQRSMTTVNEFGAATPRHFPGRMQHAVTLQRVVGSQGNMLGMLYRWLLEYHTGGGYNVAPLLPTSQRGTPLQATTASELIEVPFGLYLVSFNEVGAYIASWYWEKCLLQSHARSLSATNPTVLENVQLVFAREVATPNLLLADDTTREIVWPEQAGDPVSQSLPDRPVLRPLPEPPAGETLSMTAPGDGVPFDSDPPVA